MVIQVRRRHSQKVAAELIAALKTKSAFERWVEAIDVAGPGFINLRLRPAAQQRVVADILAAGDAYGRQPALADAAPVLVAFVSANPPGPLPLRPAG